MPRRVISGFGGELVGEANSAEEMFEMVRAKLPDRTGEFVLWWSCLQ